MALTFEQFVLVVWSVVVLIWFVFEFLVDEPLVSQSTSLAFGDGQLMIEADSLSSDVYEMNNIDESGYGSRMAVAAEDDDDGSCSFQALHSELKQMKKMVELLLPHKDNLDVPVNDDVISACSSPVQSACCSHSPEIVNARLLLDRLRILEKEKSELVVENGNQRRQYERCLNDVTSHVIHVLAAQKGLRADCLRLQQKVQHLEEHNQRLQHLVQRTFNTLTYSSLRVLNEAAALVGVENLNGEMNQATESCNSLQSVSSTLVSSSNSMVIGLDSHSSVGSRSTRSTVLSGSSRCNDGSSISSTFHLNAVDRAVHGLHSTIAKHSENAAIGCAGAGECPANCCYSELPGLRSCFCRVPHHPLEPDGGQRLLDEECNRSVSGSYCDLTNDEQADRSASPGASLLSLEDSFDRKFVVDENGAYRSGCMRLRDQLIRRPLETDSESEDPCSSAAPESRCGRSRRYVGGGTESTTSLNDFLDGTGGNVDVSDMTSAAGDESGGEDCGGGAGEETLDDSDYERLVVDNVVFSGGPAADGRNASLLSPVFRSTQPPVVPDRPHRNLRTVVPADGVQVLDTNEDATTGHFDRSDSDCDDDDYVSGGDYARLTEDRLSPPRRSLRFRQSKSTFDATVNHAERSALGNLPYSSSARSFRQEPPELPPRTRKFSSMPTARTSGPVLRPLCTSILVPPNKLLLHRRKYNSSRQGRFRHQGDIIAATTGGGSAAGTRGKLRVMFSSTSLSSSTSSYDDGAASSLGSREWAGCHLSEGGGSDNNSVALVAGHSGGRPLGSGTDDGYCTARSGRAPPPEVVPRRSSAKLLCPLNWILSSSEDVATSAPSSSPQRSSEERNCTSATLSNGCVPSRTPSRKSETVGRSLDGAVRGSSPAWRVVDTDRWTPVRCWSESRLNEPNCWDSFWIESGFTSSSPEFSGGNGAPRGRSNSFRRSLSDPGFLLSQSLASRQEYLLCGGRRGFIEGDSLDSSMADEVDFKRALDMFAFLDDQDAASVNCTI